MSFAIFLVGIVLVVGGVAWALSVAGVSSVYIGIAVLILAGIGVMAGVSRTRSKDTP